MFQGKSTDSLQQIYVCVYICVYICIYVYICIIDQSLLTRYDDKIIKVSVIRDKIY